ncbi:peptidase [Mycobacterium sp. NPDC050041]|uniref:peptidase n=1 Tax=Mycobacterium sp. NPDC050041 TaxID=3364293 RepID=UPI003C30D99F
MTSHRKRSAAALGVLALCTAALLAGCGNDTTVKGTPVSGLFDPFSVGGLPVTDGPSDVRDDAPPPVGEVRDTDGGQIDQLMLLTTNDVANFWQQNYGTLPGAFRPVQNFLSYDSQDPQSPEVCGARTYKRPNAFYCHRERLIAWDRGLLVPLGVKYFGKTSAAGLMAHEYGHAVQRMAGLVNPRTPTIVFEQQADCFAGAYMRWVAEDESPRFTLSTGDGLNKILAAVIASRDPVLTPADAEMIEEGHGTALDRVTAAQIGFVSGVSACAAIDLDEIYQRRGDIPMVLQADEETGSVNSGQLPIGQESISSLVEVLNVVYKPEQPPALSFDTSAVCPDAKAAAPVTYCPGTNTIAADLPMLEEMGRAANEDADGVLLQGDNTALSAVTSRYMVALQHQRGLALDTATAAMRTACLTGAADRELVEPITLPSGGNFQLTAGDVDESVSGLLTNGIGASDVNGYAVPAGFTRILAYRAGLQTNADRCFDQFADE